MWLLSYSIHSNINTKKVYKKRTIPNKGRTTKICLRAEKSWRMPSTNSRYWVFHSTMCLNKHLNDMKKDYKFVFVRWIVDHNNMPLTIILILRKALECHQACGNAMEHWINKRYSSIWKRNKNDFILGLKIALQII